MKQAMLAIAVFVLAAGVASAQESDAGGSIDIRVYRVLADIVGPFSVPGMDPAAKKEEPGTMALEGIAANPNQPGSLKVGGLDLALQGSEVRWNGQPEPDRPDVFLIGEAMGVAFKESAGLTLEQPVEIQPTAQAKSRMGMAGIDIQCKRLPGDQITVWLHLREPDIPIITERGTIVLRGPESQLPPFNPWTKVNVDAEPEEWACLVFSVSTVSGKPAGGIIVFFKTHGESPAPEPQPPALPQYSVEMKFINIPERVAEMVRGKYGAVQGATVSPAGAEVVDVGIEQPSFFDWLNNQKGAELLSAPRVTVAAPPAGYKPGQHAPLLKIVLRHSEPTDRHDRLPDATDYLSEFSPSLTEFLAAHKGQVPGIVADVTTVYDKDPETGDLLRNHYGIMAAVALQSMPGEDALTSSFYFNKKTIETKGRGLKFWKKPPLSTFHERPSTLDVALRERQVVAVMLPAEDGTRLLIAVSLEKAQEGKE